MDERGCEHDFDFYYSDDDYGDDPWERMRAARRADESFSRTPSVGFPLKTLALAVFLGMIGWSFILVPIIAYWGKLLTFFGAR